MSEQRHQVEGLCFDCMSDGITCRAIVEITSDTPALNLYARQLLSRRLKFDHDHGKHHQGAAV